MVGVKIFKKKYHLFRDRANKNKLEIEYCKIELKFADIFTKPLKRAIFKCLKETTWIIELADMN